MINWIIQKNLTKTDLVHQLKTAIEADGAFCELVEIVPFSTKLPAIKHKNAFTIPYGSTTFMLNAYQNEVYQRGVFYNSLKFQMKHYVEVWKEDMLNFDGQLLKFSDLQQLDSPPSQKWFIRPNLDEKQFSGRISTFQELLEWSEKIIQLNLPDFNANTEIWISTSQHILKEWRLFIIDDKIVSACRYIKNGQINISSSDVPIEMLEFAQAKIDAYRIDDVYVMDIAATTAGFKIIECNCFNGTGFYDNDIRAIVKTINQYIRNSKN